MRLFWPARSVLFPKDHAEVMVELLGDWNVPSELYQPLNYTLSDYADLARLPEPMRTKAELVKLAIVVGRIAVGSWESWDLVELPSSRLLNRLGIAFVDEIIEQTKAELPGIPRLGVDAVSAKNSDCEAQSCQLDYCRVSDESFDFLAEMVSLMGM